MIVHMTRATTDLDGLSHCRTMAVCKINQGAMSDSLFWTEGCCEEIWTRTDERAVLPVRDEPLNASRIPDTRYFYTSHRGEAVVHLTAIQPSTLARPKSSSQ